MSRYVLRRLLQAVPVLVGTSFLVFAMVFLLPGDPVRALGGDRALPPAVVAQLRSDFHLDRPFLVQYLLYVRDLLHGDLGTDFHGRPVGATIERALPVTVALAAVAVVLEVVLGVLAGVLAGLRRGGVLDNLVLVSTTVLVAVPVLVLALVSQYLFGYELGWLPITGGDGLRGYLLPGLVLAAGSLAYVARLTRAGLTDDRHSGHVRTARAKGLPRRTVVLRHTLRPALVPVVTFVGADATALLGGAVVTEAVFDLPGLGREVYQAVGAHEGAVVVGIVTLMVALAVVVNLVVDVLCALVDPRIRLG